MPKRALKHKLDNTSNISRKSLLDGDPSQLSGNLDIDPNEHKIVVPLDNSEKHIQKLKFNKNNEVERLLRHNSKMLIYHVDHSDFPAFNVGMWPQETNDMLTNYPSCAFSCPRPIYVSDKQCEKFDICFKRPMKRDSFIKRTKHTRSTYKTALKSNKNVRYCIKEDIYHSSLFDMAERIYIEPDPFFQSSYDFYFTGGNLCVLPNQGRIIHTGGENLQELLVSEFSDTESLRKVASLKASQNCEIFEVHPLIISHDSSRQNSVIVRQRNLVSFNYLKDNQMKTVTEFRTKSTPFISFAQSKHDINNFIITTMKQHIRLYDLNNGLPSLVKLFQISPNSPNISWNTVKSWRENTFMYANEKQFFMIDIRSSPDQWLNKITFTADSLVCDHISAVLPSDFSNLFYLATNHQLQCMDIRYLKKYSLSDSGGAICRWTHLLRYPPLMVDTFRLRQTEYIALSSPIAGDLHICQLSRERTDDSILLESSLHVPKHIYSSPCLPYQPPTLLETYEAARLSGKCLRPEANLEARVKCCTTGMKFLNTGLTNSNTGIGLLLTTNSNGDVFAHTLSKREQKEPEERCNRQSNEIMAKLEREVCKKTKLSLNYTEIKNMKGLRKVFLCKSLSSVKKFDFSAIDNDYNEDVLDANNGTNLPGKGRPKRFHLGGWQKSLSTLHNYKDALVADILSIWDIDIEEEKNIRLGTLDRKIGTDSKVKVDDWLEKNINHNPPMLSIPLQEMSRYCDNDTSHIFNSTINTSQTQNTILDFENAVHSTQILDNSVNIPQVLDSSGAATAANNETSTGVMEKRKSKKKNKTYIKGF